VVNIISKFCNLSSCGLKILNLAGFSQEFFKLLDLFEILAFKD